MFSVFLSDAKPLKCMVSYAVHWCIHNHRPNHHR